MRSAKEKWQISDTNVFLASLFSVHHTNKFYLMNNNNLLDFMFTNTCL